MKACVQCEKELTMWNVPSKSVRVLKDGREICASCLQSISKLIPNLQVKEYTEHELKSTVDKAQDHINLTREKISNLRFGKMDEGGINKTLKDLQDNINDSEDLIGVIHVFDDENRNGGFFITSKRIICICKGLGIGTKTTDFPYAKISSIEFKSSFLKSKITIHVTGNTSEYSVHDKDLANQIVKFVREKLVEKIDLPKVESKDNEDVFAQIEKLSLLREKGILTEEEFNKKKVELLNRI
jgi:ArsR family metal-binding transcriptional regulator